MNIKKIFALLLAAVMVLALAACAEKAPEETVNILTESTATPTEGTAAANDDTTASAGKNAITVKVVHSDGSEKVFTYNTDEEFLGDVLLADGLIKGNEGPYGLEISEVDGETAVYATDKAYWALFEGDQYALQGISTTPIKDGGEYGLVYTKG